MGAAIKNPQLGIWLNDDDPADKKYKKSEGGSVQTYLPELETVKELNAHRRLLRSHVKAMRDKSFSDFLSGNENAMYEIRKIENKIKLINKTIMQLERK